MTEQEAAAFPGGDKPFGCKWAPDSEPAKLSEVNDDLNVCATAGRKK
jgi:hypothetical protein